MARYDQRWNQELMGRDRVYDNRPYDNGFGGDDNNGAYAQREGRAYRRRRGRSGVPVFDKTLQTTHIWLSDIMDEIGPDRRHAWKVLAVVLRTLRDRLPLGVAAHLGAQLPLLVRGIYYDQFTPGRQPTDYHLRDFIIEVQYWLSDSRPTDPRDATRAVFRTLSRHIPTGEIENVQGALPDDIADFWMSAEEAVVPPPETRRGRRSQAQW
jgi:uncharacterized protein (DUF2267 family)